MSAQEYENKGDRPETRRNVGRSERPNAEKGTPPPIKMDCFENKGVAGGAFCKRLNRKGMDDSK
jgi:hypothetical protein